MVLVLEQFEGISRTGYKPVLPVFMQRWDLQNRIVAKTARFAIKFMRDEFLTHDSLAAGRLR